MVIHRCFRFLGFGAFALSVVSVLVDREDDVCWMQCVGALQEEVLTTSPYQNVPIDRWPKTTRRLVDAHPLTAEEIVEVVLNAWESIFSSRMGSKGFVIGVDIVPKPQIMGFLLHALIPLEFAARFPDQWRAELDASDRDIVYLPDDRFSIELKTSSNARHIYGNRSYAQESPRKKKLKSGYYLAVNFEKFTEGAKHPRIAMIRFGWLDACDWLGQRAATGQQSRLPPEVVNAKLITFYSAS